jgi:quinol-cytochrome oxidoreductase complex cytochrome b subunit
MIWLIRYVHAKWCIYVFYCCDMHIHLEDYTMEANMKPRQMLWNIGVAILFLMIITAFNGLRFTMGSNGLFGVQTVITNLFSASSSNRFMKLLLFYGVDLLLIMQH